MRFHSLKCQLSRVSKRARGLLHKQGLQERVVDRQQRIYVWRRRVLLKKGARIHAARLDDGDRCSLAMLDGQGIVVAWYGESNDASRLGVNVVGRHVAQFYLPADIAENVPSLNLLSATICGSNTQQGWRRSPSGAIIWGTTAIEAIVLNDGRLQGFSHIVRTAEGPRADVRAQVHPPRWSEALHWNVHRSTRRHVVQARAIAG